MGSSPKDSIVISANGKKNELRVLIVTSFSEIIGGAEESLRIFLSNALKLYPNCCFGLLPIQGGDPKGKTFKKVFAKEIACFPPLEKDRFSYFKLPLYWGKLLRRKRDFEKYDLIYANSQMAGLFGVFISSIVRKRFIIHLRQLLEPESLSSSLFCLSPGCFKLFGINFSKKIVSWIVGRRNSTAIAISKSIKKELGQLQKIKVINNAIDSNWFNSVRKDDVNSFVERYQVCIDETHIAFLGNLVPIKGVEYLIEAVNIVKMTGEYRHLKLLIVGDSLNGRFSDYKEKLLAIVKDEGLEADVHFIGRVQDVRPVYDISDVVVLPSLSEGFGRTIIEAMAYGTPVIGSKVGGIPEIIEDGIDGLLVPPKDAGAIANAIIRLMQNKEFYSSISKSARIKAQYYNAEDQARRIMHAMQEACET